MARALAIEPEALLLDEPFSALDDYLRSHMVEQLTETLTDYRGVTLFVSHNMDEIYSIADKLIVLSLGKIEAKGRTDDVFRSPPSLVSAQLTGCRNFSPTNYIAPFELEALDWGIYLKSKQEISRQIKFVGIRTYTLELATDETSENVFRGWLNYARETPTRVTVYIATDKESGSQDNHLIQWEITKQLWLAIKDKPQPWNLHISPEDLIII